MNTKFVTELNSDDNGNFLSYTTSFEFNNIKYFCKWDLNTILFKCVTTNSAEDYNFFDFTHYDTNDTSSIESKIECILQQKREFNYLVSALMQDMHMSLVEATEYFDRAKEKADQASKNYRQCAEIDDDFFSAKLDQAIQHENVARQAYINIKSNV